MATKTPIEFAHAAANCAKKHDRMGFKATLGEMVKMELPLGVNWLPMAQFASMLGEVNLAKAALELLMKQKPQQGNFIHAAGLYAEWGDIQTAVEILNKVPYGERDNRWYHLSGVIFSQQGELELAVAAFEEALKKFPSSMPTWMSLAKIKALEEAQLKLLTSIDPAQLDILSQAQFYTSLTEHYSAMGDIKSSDDCLDKANHLMTKMYAQNGYSNKPQFEEDAKIKANFSNLKPLAQTEFEHYAPVFIVGLPRSGTTLLARILTSHKDLEGGHEYALCRKALLPQEIHDLSIDKLRFGEQFVDLQRQRGLKPSMRVVDKSIDLHRYVGLLAEVFPKAHFVFIDRNEQDNKWSCYRNFFSTGVPWSYSEDQINEYFNNFYHLVSHWKGLLGERAISVNYEQLVGNPQKVLKPLFSSLGLSFDENVLEFYQRKTDLVNTVSFKQVRQPLNDKSIGSARRVF